MIKLAYLLGAIGGPQFGEKMDILRNNLSYLEKTCRITLFVHQYDDNQIPEEIRKMVEAIHLYRGQGFLTTLVLDETFEDRLREFDYILFTLDDIRFEKSFDIHELTRLKKSHHLDFISPCILGADHPEDFVQKENLLLTINNHIELFCLLLTFESYQKFLKILCRKNERAWGYDLVWSQNGLRVGVASQIECMHLMRNLIGSRSEAAKQMGVYLKERGMEDCRKMDPIIEYIYRG